MRWTAERKSRRRIGRLRWRWAGGDVLERRGLLIRDRVLLGDINFIGARQSGLHARGRSGLGLGLVWGRGTVAQATLSRGLVGESMSEGIMLCFGQQIRLRTLDWCLEGKCITGSWSRQLVGAPSG